jgi:hypothetical protein
MDKHTQEQRIYDLVVIGNLLLSTLYIQVIHEQNRRHAEPDYTWVTIIAGVIANVSAAGIRTRLYPPDEQTISRYDRELLRMFCLSGFGIIVPWQVVRKVFWHWQARRMQESSRRYRRGNKAETMACSR